MSTLLAAGSPLREFRVFAEVVWHHLKLPRLTPNQAEICDWLQHGPKRSQTWGFRGVGKSYLTAAYACHSLLVNPNEKVLVISASKDRADSFVRFAKRLINEVPILQHLRPNRLRGDRDSATMFDVGACDPADMPSVKAIGITGQMTGSRGSVIIMDDIEVPANSGTPAQRETLRERAKEVDAIILPDNEEMGIKARIRVLGTPQSMETVYLQLEEGGYVPRIWPIQVPDSATYLGYRGHLAPSADAAYKAELPAGTPLEPSRFPEGDIAQRRLSYGALSFALQFMLSTALSDAEKYPLKCRDAIFSAFEVDRVKEVYIHSRHPQYRIDHLECPGMQGDGFYAAADTVGDWVKPDQSIVVVDPSGRGADETAVGSLSGANGYIFVHRVFGLRSGYDESTLLAIAEEAKRIKASKVVVESNFGDGMFSRLLQPVLARVYPCTVEEVKNNVQKERRIIDTLAPVLEAHRLIFHDSIPESDTVPHADDSDTRSRFRQLFYQLTHLTDEKGCLAHDDRLDALSMGVAFLQQYINLDAQKERREREMAWLDDFMSSGARDPLTPCWSDYADL